MATTNALPFFFSRSASEMTGAEYAQTTERIHGLLRLEGDRVVLQWRAARETERYGMGYRTDREFDPVREVVLPLEALAGAELRARRWFGRGPEVVLTATDLRAFEEVAGASGLRMDHPASLVLPIRPGDRLAAREFAADLNLALAERSMSPPERPDRLEPGPI